MIHAQPIILDEYGIPISMQAIIPPGKSGTVSVEHDEISFAIALAYNFECLMLGKPSWYTANDGPLVRLQVDGRVMMSDSQMERRTNAPIIKAASGDVLLAGLGIGMVPVSMLQRPEVRSITIIELNPDVITLVEPHIRDPRVTVIEADIFTWEPERRYDILYFDIWPNIDIDNLGDIERLHARYRENAALPGALVTSWLYDYLRERRRRKWGVQDA